MEATAALRDIAIIAVAIGSLFVYIMIAVLVWQVWRLTKYVQTEVKPVIDDAKETLATVRGTTAFMSENAVAPTVRASAQVAGARRTLQVLAQGIWPGNGPTPPPPPV
ncbi:MAG: hypothetical protein ACRC1H_15750 [Caldilineaceae bacterium]